MPQSTEYLKAPYARMLIPEEQGGYSAAMVEFPGCFAEGETADEAMQALDRAAAAWIRAALAQGQAIPPPCRTLAARVGAAAARVPDAWAAERLALRREVMHQWFMNHAEHCGHRIPPWPHTGDCHWPMPPVMVAMAPSEVYLLLLEASGVSFGFRLGGLEPPHRLRSR